MRELQEENPTDTSVNCIFHHHFDPLSWFSDFSDLSLSEHFRLGFRHENYRADSRNNIIGYPFTGDRDEDDWRVWPVVQGNSESSQGNKEEETGRVKSENFPIINCCRFIMNYII